MENRSLFDSQADVWINTVNTRGVMGAGVAKEFSKRFRTLLKPYERACYDRKLHPGDILPIPILFPPPHVIVCFATKDHWKNPSKIEWIESGLEKLSAWAKRQNIKSVAVPALGCGNGGLQWNLVEPLILEHLGWLGEGLEVYPPWTKY